MANDCFAFHHVYALIVLMLVYLHQGEFKSQAKSSGYLTTGVQHNEQMKAATYSSQYKQQQQEQQQT
jgi:hypothetical protein